MPELAPCTPSRNVSLVTSPVDIMIRATIIVSSGRRTVVKIAFATGVVNVLEFISLIAVPRHPFHKQVCKFAIHPFLTALGLLLVGASIAIG